MNEKKDDQIQEANIIPVINIDSGTPLTERPDYLISIDHSKTSFKHKINEDDNRSEKSNLIDTSHKLFEKLTGSLTALSKTIRTSLERESGDESEHIDDLNLEYDIDVVGTSPGNDFIATWSSENGVLAVFSLDSQQRPTETNFWVKTSFNKKNTSDAKIYISVSEDGQYVVITRTTILEESYPDSPNMDAAIDEPESFTPESSFAIYSTRRSKDDDDYSIFDSIEISGPLVFVHHHRLVCFAKNHMHLLSTKNWTIQSSFDMNALIHSVPNYSNTSNEYLEIIYDSFVESLRYGYLVWPEERLGLSVWDINGSLKQWFYVNTRNIPYTRNLFAISSKGDLVARFYEDKRSNTGTLRIFHTPTALRISNIDVPKNTFLISFLHKTDQIVLCSKKDEGVSVQLWDCWAGLLVYEERWTYLSYNKPLLLIDDKFIQAVGNELFTYSLFPNNSPSVTMEALIRTSTGCKAGKTGLIIITTLEEFSGLPGMNTCWGNIFNDKNDLLCKFKFEPWHNWHNREIFIHWLDSEGKRFIMVGRDSIQVYRTKQKSNQRYLKIDLQYIWISKDDDIKLVTLETREEADSEKTILHVQLANNDTISLPLPEEDDKITYRVVTDACKAIHYLRLQYMDDIQYFSRLVIWDQLRKLIDSSIQLFPSAFNKISLGNDEYVCPMEDFIILGWDDIVKDIIEANKYIPIFHNDEQTESALLLLVELQKSVLVDLMVDYIIKQTKNVPAWSNSSNFDHITKRIVQQPGFAWTLGKTLLDLYHYYPDKGIYVMKESSYFTTSLEAPRRILNTELGNLTKSEERSYFDEFKPVTRKARLPKGTKYQAEKRKSQELTRNDTGALVYYPETSLHSEKHMNKETYEMRRKQRKQRLEDARKTHPAKLCVVPWPDFCVYPQLRENHDSSLYGKISRFWDIYVSPMQRSPFADVALSGSSEMFSGAAMEAIIKFKWKKFAKKLFFLHYGVYLIHAFLFCIIFSVDSKIVAENGIINKWKLPFFVIESFIPFVFVIQELRQMSGRWKVYWSSVFNYVDLASFCLPLACMIMVMLEKEPPPSLKSFAVLCVWVNALLQSRAFAGPGKFIAIVIEIAKKIVTLFLTLLVIVFGFANAMFILLRDVSPLDIVQSYNGTLTDDTGKTIGNISMIQIPQENTNMWNKFDYSIMATYFFLGIGWDSVMNFDPNFAMYIMMILFSLVAVIMLLNILIGLITEVFSVSLQVGRQAWLRQRAELIAELELFLLSPSRRQHPDWFPHLVYYEAHLDSIKHWGKKLYVEEMGELDASFVRKELKNIKDDLNSEIKELKGMVGQIREHKKTLDGDLDKKSRHSAVSV